MKTLIEIKNEFIMNKITPTNWLGDSVSRMDTYTQYAQKVDTVVEFGVYTGVSTCAFLLGNPKKLYSYDITSEYISILPELYHYSKENNIEFVFELKNSLEYGIPNTDLLFIDTVHKKKHTSTELELHHIHVNKYIILHDAAQWEGVLKAACDFLLNHKNWHIIEHDNKNSGLLVLEKYND